MTTAAYKLIPLTDLIESPLNPRKHFDQAKIEELRDSIRAHGILTPLLVRPNPHGKKKGYEIAAGHRRFRAALLAMGEDGTAPFGTGTTFAIHDHETISEALDRVEARFRQTAAPGKS